MSLHVEVNLSACQGYANCVVTAPDVFDLSDAGKAVVLPDGLKQVDRSVLEEAVASCPAHALTLLERP